MLNNLPKAELHVHLEGTITPDKAKELAKKYGKELPANIFNDDKTTYFWEDDSTAASALRGFLHSYDVVTSLLQSAEDYKDITYDYLMRSAAEGVIYTELIISADHGKMIGLSYKEMVDAIAEGVEKAKNKTGIECRLLSACVRHFGPENAIEVAKQTKDYPHELVTGFTMAGDENAFSVADFVPAFKIACEEGRLQATAHAGEAAGPESVKNVLYLLGCKRFGHMVRAIEDGELLKELKEHGAVPEICISSNMALKVFKTYDEHPLRQFYNMGFDVTLGSDDPSFFNTSIGKEYEIAKEKFYFSEEELLQITQNAVNAAFVDEEVREKLLNKIGDYKLNLIHTRQMINKKRR